jgi:hypothetical protein
VYTVALTVSDGSLTSAADQVNITVATGNLPPLANAGPDQTVTTGQVVTLSGTRSTDPNGDPLTYSWCLKGRPVGSNATLNGATTAQPTFTPDVAGSYVFCLTVNDGQTGSTSDSVVIEARLPRFNQGAGFNGVVNSIVLAQDGSGDIYVAGEFTAYKGTVANRLIRLHPDGTVAQTFGQVEGVPYLALAKTGGLYVREITHFDGQPVPPVIRLTRTGSLDPAFRLPAEFSSSSGPVFLDHAFATAEDGSGDVYVTFRTPNPNPTTPVDQGFVNIARLNADGTVDPAFSSGSGFPTESGARGNPQIITNLLPTSTGKLYVGGSLYLYNGVPVSSLLRLNPDGTLDSTFVVTSLVYVSGAPVVEVNGLAPVEDGTQDLYVGGRINNGGSVRLHDTGATDTSYQPAVPLLPYAITPTHDGSRDLLIASSGSTLHRFDRIGAVVTQFRRPALDNAIITIVPVQDGTGDFYIGGYLTTYNGVPVNHFARVHADGTLASVVSGGP